MFAEIGYRPLVRIQLIGDLAVSPHGIFTAFGFLVGATFFLRHTRRLGFSDDTIIAGLTRAAMGALVGARVFYVVNNFSSYASPVEWFKVWEGGISLLGGLFGAMVVAWWFTRRAGLDFLQLVDVAAPWLPLGVAIGRIGDIAIADHLGRTTTMPWGFRCPDNPEVGVTVGSPCPSGQVVHLTAAYDLLAGLAIFGVILSVRHRFRLGRGHAALLAAVLYGANRFTLDFLRADDRRFGLTGSQWTALAVVIVGVSLLSWRRGGPARADDHDGSRNESNDARHG